jgi:hypothetical protein
VTEFLFEFIKDDAKNQELIIEQDNPTTLLEGLTKFSDHSAVLHNIMAVMVESSKRNCMFVRLSIYLFVLFVFSVVFCLSDFVFEGLTKFTDYSVMLQNIIEVICLFFICFICFLLFILF